MTFHITRADKAEIRERVRLARMGVSAIDRLMGIRSKESAELKAARQKLDAYVEIETQKHLKRIRVIGRPRREREEYMRPHSLDERIQFLKDREKAINDAVWRIAVALTGNPQHPRWEEYS